MKDIFFKIISISLTVFMFLSCTENEPTKPEDDPIDDPGVFDATGNTNPNNSLGDPGDVGPFPAQVEVTFASPYSDLKMRFCPPARPVLVSENGIEYSSGYAETYDPDTGIEGSFEVYADFDNNYTSMWIELKNNARIIVRWKGALVAHVEGQGPKIAHAEDNSGSPYGNGSGDWVDEIYYIYPDAIRTRYATIYTAFASTSQPFGFDREPPNYVHEFMEMTVWSYGNRIPSNDIDITALTLVNMEGQSSDISYSSYPSYPHGFGNFEYSNIVRINIKSDWRPFVIGRTDNVTIRPYDAEETPDPFQSWGERGIGFATALGHMVNWQHFEQTSNTISQLYLEGLTNTDIPGADLAALANSWINPPGMTITSDGFSIVGRGYQAVERAYHVRKDSGSNLEFTLNAGTESPGVRPAFVIEGWGTTVASTVRMNDISLKENSEFRQGIEGENLIIWINKELTSAASFSVEE
jgi:hypothetical protein